MGSIGALTILFCIYAVSELIAVKTRAILSTVLGISVILLAGFWSGILPRTLIRDAQVSGIGMAVVGMLIVALGTTIDFAELKREWKVVVTSVLCVVFAVAAIILGGRFVMDPKIAIAGAPIFAGGNAATLIMLAAAKEKGLAYVGTSCLALLVTQKFFGIPVASVALRRLARQLRQDETFVGTYCAREEEVRELTRKKPVRLPSLFDKPSVYLAKLGLVATVAFYAARLTHGHIHYLVMCLIMGVVFYFLGFLDKGILGKTQSSGMLIFFVTIVIFSNLGATTPQQVVSVLPPLIWAAILGVAGLCVAAALCSRVLAMPFTLAVALGITCTFGFPTTMLVSQEVASAMGETEDQRKALENYLLPKMLVAGFVTVTITSVVLAGFVVNIL
ncbi:hypothetical protein [Acidaminococcus sp.]|uniref:hypothetical protein n=1 Tax=Acidaminococcus sp. TaxID=1872103 RepID=UPI003D7D7AC4